MHEAESRHSFTWDDTLLALIAERCSDSKAAPFDAGSTEDGLI